MMALLIDTKNNIVIQSFEVGQDAVVSDDGSTVTLGGKIFIQAKTEQYLLLSEEGGIGWNWDGNNLLPPMPLDMPQEAVDANQKHAIRSVIAQNVGDTASLVGTVSDTTGLLIAIALADVVALSSNTSFADYRKAKLDTLKLLAGDADIAALAGSALTQIKDGDAVLTASLKGLDNVITESLTRSTAVAIILSQAAQQQAPSE